MARYIDADAFNEYLRKGTEANADIIPQRLVDTVLDIMDGIMLDIDEQPTVDAVPRWIPCKERLPELDEICLVTEKDGSIRHCYFDSIDPVLFATVEEGMYVENVVAWMPLPEPYDGERKDDD